MIYEIIFMDINFFYPRILSHWLCELHKLPMNVMII